MNLAVETDNLKRIILLRFMASEREKALRDFVKVFENSIYFSFKDIDELKRLIMNLFDRVREVEESRDSWKQKYLNMQK